MQTPAEAYVPTAQGVQLAAPATLMLAAGQGMHCASETPPG